MGGEWGSGGVWGGCVVFRGLGATIDVEKSDEHFDFQVFFRDVRGRLGCVNLSSVVSRT